MNWSLKLVCTRVHTHLDFEKCTVHYITTKTTRLRLAVQTILLHMQSSFHFLDSTIKKAQDISRWCIPYSTAPGNPCKVLGDVCTDELWESSAHFENALIRGTHFWHLRLRQECPMQVLDPLGRYRIAWNAGKPSWRASSVLQNGHWCQLPNMFFFWVGTMPRLQWKHPAFTIDSRCFCTLISIGIFSSACAQLFFYEIALQHSVTLLGKS